MEELVLATLPCLFSGFVLWYIKRSFSKRDKEAAEKEQRMIDHNTLMLKGMFASLGIGEATAEALVTGKCNGALEEARTEARLVKKDIEKFTLKQCSQSLTK